eukprot:TRINITY_DN23237_c0_g1_i3.p1 TRINITY_DN23237_c0_g1~~TRINITY_DN23237_c0_g1_i3.p1  ORF type:complete len:287 (+),score=70.01 TRINITY_DN23237_c0_g1_i3:106-966(+)
MIRRPPRSTLSSSSAASDVYKRQVLCKSIKHIQDLPAHESWSDGVDWVRSPLGIAVAIPLTCFAFQCQIQVPPIYAGLRKKNKCISGFNKVILTAYSLCIALYVPVGCFGYFQFKGDTPHDILEKSGEGAGYPLDDVQVLVARVAIMCSSIGAYPLNHFPARAAFFKLSMPAHDDDTMSNCLTDAPKPLPPMSNRFLLTSTLIFWVLSLVLAILIHDLSSVFDILGSTAAVVVIFIVPSQLWRHLARVHQTSLAPSWTLLIFGLVVGCVCTVVALLNIAAPDVVSV